MAQRTAVSGKPWTLMTDLKMIQKNQTLGVNRFKNTVTDSLCFYFPFYRMHKNEARFYNFKMSKSKRIPLRSLK